MKRLLLALAAISATSVPAYCEDAPVVVELFTSQGCSSCPPADAMMETLAKRPDVIALSLHVDYWDYIGWKDEFADPEHSLRQRGYATLAGRGSVYTPELIVDGVSDIVGAKPMEVAMAIEKHKANKDAVEVSLRSVAPDMVEISATALVPGLEPMDVMMLRYQPTRVARITRGENAGRTIEYMNVVQDWQVLSRWDGRKPFLTRTKAAGDFPVVVLVQAADLGPIHGAARLVPR